MDRFHELSAFIAVVEAGGFSAAARRTGESQSLVSKAVSALERRLGVQLLNRTTRSVSVTHHGRTYYERMKPLLEEMEHANEELVTSTQEISGLIRIATSATFGRLHVLPLVPALLARYPRLRLELKLSDSVQDLLAEGVDLAIRVSPIQSPDAVIKRVSGTSLVCVGSHAYFTQHGLPRVPEDLLKHNCLVYNDMRNWTFTGPQGRFSVPVSGNLSSNTVETILSAVHDGVGIGMFYGASLVGQLHDAGIVRILEQFIDEERDVSLVWPSRKFISARVRQVSDFLANALAARL